MGNQKTKNPTRIEIFLQESYKYLNFDFSNNEITAFNLKLADAENYFFTKFIFIFFFNSNVFTENLSTLYDNFNQKVERFSRKNAHKLFTLLIEFDDESETILFGGKIDFESLFAIIFEKLEIHLVISFDLTSCKLPYITELITQLYENASLYKCNRQYDSIYCLLPNTDYFIKHSSTLTYTSNRKKGIFSKDNEEMLSLLVLTKYRKKYIQTKKTDPETCSYYEKAIEKISAVNCFVFTYVDNLIEEDDIDSLLGLLFFIIRNSSQIVFCILINKKNNLPSNENFAIIMGRIVALCEKEEKLKEIAIKICFTFNDFSLSQIYFNESVKIIRGKLSNKSFRGLKFSIKISQINQKKSNSSREYATFNYTCAQLLVSNIKRSDSMIILFVLKKRFNKIYNNTSKRAARTMKKNILSFHQYSTLNNFREKKEAHSGIILKEDFKKDFVFKKHFLF